MLDVIEKQIYETYQWWAKQAPGVTPREEGRLADLWRVADDLIRRSDTAPNHLSTH